jgi:hypothetical protein
MVQVTKCIEKDTERKMVTETERVKDLAGAEGDVCGIVFGRGGEGGLRGHIPYSNRPPLLFGAGPMP